MPLDGGGELDLDTRVNVVLSEAADLIEHNGWCQGKTEDGGRFCVFGAVRNRALSHSWVDATNPAMARMWTYVGLDPTHWQDALHAETGKQIVVDTLRRASGLER